MIQWLPGVACELLTDSKECVKGRGREGIEERKKEGTEN
jgi:hypothetical protein